MISFLVCAFLTMMAFIYLVSLKLRSNRIA
jgi:hypothetical protein